MKHLTIQHCRLEHLQAKANVETDYSNIEREVLGILHGLEKFHHYCFTCEVSVITDHKPMVAIFKKNVASLSQRLKDY